MYNAIYHLDSYYLLPEEYPDFAAFTAHLAAQELPCTLKLVPLLEDNNHPSWTVSRGICMAPYFLTGYRDQPVRVAISDPADVYPAVVERLTQAEYNARLRRMVEGFCPGCASFGALTEDDASLNGHHEEISLDGVCFFRHEGANPPRCFQEGLEDWLACLLDSPISNDSAAQLQMAARQHLHLSCSGAALTVLADGALRLTMSTPKQELLPPLLALAMGAAAASATEGDFHVAPESMPDLSPDGLSVLTAPARENLLRWECRKYGTALARLLWDGQDAGRIAASLTGLVQDGLVFPLHVDASQAFLLLLNEPIALKALRYRSPLLQPHHAQLTLWDAAGVRRCPVTYSMALV